MSSDIDRLYATMTLHGAYDVKVKLFADGGVMLRQGSDLVYLSAEHVKALTKFIANPEG